ncbi:isochorismatase family protein [Caldiplasma sukawensis]
MDSNYILDFLNVNNIVAMALNNNLRNFETIYGKMEYFTAMEYFKDFCSGKNIECYNVETNNLKKNRIVENDEGVLRQFDNEVKYKFKSSYEMEYIGKFHEIELNGQHFSSDGVNGTKIIKEKLGDLSEYNIIIIGINTEREVLMNAIYSVDEGANVGIISDCVSSRSERLHFNSLEIMSKFAYVFDTRDMQSIENQLK